MDRSAADFLEIVAETCFAQRSTRQEAVALSRSCPVVPHGVKLSLGSSDGIDDVRAARLGALAREVDAPLVSEHVAFTRARSSTSHGAVEREIGHLTQLPRSREAVKVVARNVARLRSRLPDVPLLLENVAWSVLWPDDEMDEATFYCEIVDATGCELLLDVGNLYANAINEGLDPAAVLDAYPLARVGMVHLAGGVLEDGFYFDTHAHPVPDPVFALLGRIFAVRPNVPVLLERDGDLGSFAPIRGELDYVRALRPRPVAARSGTSNEVRAATSEASAIVPARTLALADAQGQLAELLVGPRATTDVPTELARRIGARALSRARAILERKRVDDALPLLGRLSLRSEEIRALAERAMREHVRPPRGAGPADALRIAEAASTEPSLRDDALADRLLLRARFTKSGTDGCLGPRVLPFVGAERLADGTQLRVVKGFGAFAPVRRFEGKARSWKPNSRPSLPR